MNLGNISEKLAIFYKKYIPAPLFAFNPLGGDAPLSSFDFVLFTCSTCE
jgi:hypothetical protein